MSVPTIIVDGKTPEGKRLSISVDFALWSLYLASRNNDIRKARTDIKTRMNEGKITNTYDAKRWIYTEIAHPSLVQQTIEQFEPA